MNNTDNDKGIETKLTKIAVDHIPYYGSNSPETDQPIMDALKEAHDLGWQAGQQQPGDGWVSKEELERRLLIAGEFSKAFLCSELLKIPTSLLIKYGVIDADLFAAKINEVHNPEYPLPTPPTK